MKFNESPPQSPRASSDSIELAEFDEVGATSDRHHRNSFRRDSALPDLIDEGDEEDSDVEDKGDRALLGSHARAVSPSPPTYKPSTWAQVRSIVIETFPTLLLTTTGLLFTGNLLNKISHWKAMSRVDELIMIIPVVLNLKGNLEMNLSARLGTAANVGELDKPETRRALILGNLTLLQVQAAVVSFVAACVSYVLGRIVSSQSAEQSVEDMTGNLTSLSNATLSDNLHSRLYARVLHESRKPLPALPQTGKKISGASEFIMVASAAMCSTALSSVVLGSFMCGLVILCRRFGLDPDNIAPPVAGCLGDMVTLSILGVVSVLQVRMVDTPVPLTLVILLTIAAIGWTVVVRRNLHVRHLLTEGWSPLIAAMIISSGTGLVLDAFVSRYRGFALIAVVITGVPGSVGAIFISRLSTALHAAAMVLLPSNVDHKPHPSGRLVMITLLAVSFPIQILFVGMLYAFGWLHLSIVFAVMEVIFFALAVVISLFLAQAATNLLWKWKLDPDMYALPLHSAFMDLVGQLLLVVCYEVAALLGSKVRSPSAS